MLLSLVFKLSIWIADETYITSVLVIAWPFLTHTEETVLIIKYLGVNYNEYLSLSATIILFLSVGKLLLTGQILMLCKLISIGVMSWLVSPFIYLFLFVFLFIA